MRADRCSTILEIKWKFDWHLTQWQIWISIYLCKPGKKYFSLIESFVISTYVDGTYLFNLYFTLEMVFNWKSDSWFANITTVCLAFIELLRFKLIWVDDNPDVSFNFRFPLSHRIDRLCWYSSHQINTIIIFDWRLCIQRFSHNRRYSVPIVVSFCSAVDHFTCEVFDI